MKALTKEQAIVISAFTGKLICDFSDLHKDMEARFDRPIFTHEYPSMTDEIEAMYKADFIAMMPESDQTNPLT